MQSLAAAIVGGVSLSGGRGGVGAALFGALFVTILANGMNLAQINGYYQMIVLGATVIASVVLDRFRSHQARVASEARCRAGRHTAACG